jgi:hypothetical protein
MSEPMPNRNKPPCKGCELRERGCHDRCQLPAYLAWKAENEKIKKNKDAYYGSIWIQKELDKSLYRKHKRYR